MKCPLLNIWGKYIVGTIQHLIIKMSRKAHLMFLELLRKEVKLYIYIMRLVFETQYCK